MIRGSPEILILLVGVFTNLAWADGEPVCSALNSENIETNKWPTALAQNASTSLSANHLKSMSTNSTQECVKSCCDWVDCHIAIQSNTTCFNIHCQNLEECQLVNSETKILIQSVVVRHFQVECSVYSKSCELGVDNCSAQEECTPVANRGRNGCCECTAGMIRDPSAGTCLISSPTTLLPPTLPLTTSQAEIVTTTRYIRHLAISISPTSIQLPEIKSNITAIVVPDADPGEKYIYNWEVVSYPQDHGVDDASIEGNNEKTLKLSQLSPGNYTFRITVKSDSSFGEILANLSVLAPVHVNQHPVAIIRPTSQTVHLPNSVAILDGLSSSDDKKIVTYKWELERGPISFHFEPKLLDTLELKELVAGTYTFKLTVTDEEGESNSTLASVEVIKEQDYPPEANAGPPVVLLLPQNELTLNGSGSTDDHGIVSWEWTLMTDSSKTGHNEPVKAVDMQDTRTPYPHISGLAEGMYWFQLKVTDIAGQSSTSQVNVLVRPPPTTEPRVDAGSDTLVTLPQNWVVLDGSKSVDDVGIQKWQWTQLQGPNGAVFNGSAQSLVNATGLTKGEYIFMLTAWDDVGASANDTVNVKVVQDGNEKPKADAGGDHSVSLPLKWITLNGSGSADDLGIQSWLWTREPESLAAGSIIANSDRTSMLMLTNLVPGKYVFRLTVQDEQGLSDYDVATLIIHSNPREMDVVTITLICDPRNFKESDLSTIRDQLALLLHQQGSGNINVNIDDVVVEPKSGYVVLQFFTTVKSDSGWRTLPGTEVATLLKKKLRNDANLLAYPVLEVDTSICQNTCSGHGECDKVTRRCVCQSFWMENWIAVSRGGDYNCDWSLIYVAIVSILVLVMLLVAVWSFVHLCRKGVLPCKSMRGRCFKKPRRRPHRYSPLADPEAIRMSAKMSNSLLPSDADSDSDSDVVFESKTNGHINNGRLQPSSKETDEIRA